MCVTLTKSHHFDISKPGHWLKTLIEPCRFPPQPILAIGSAVVIIMVKTADCQIHALKDKEIQNLA